MPRKKTVKKPPKDLAGCVRAMQSKARELLVHEGLDDMSTEFEAVRDHDQPIVEDEHVHLHIAPAPSTHLGLPWVAPSGRRREGRCAMSRPGPRRPDALNPKDPTFLSHLTDAQNVAEQRYQAIVTLLMGALRDEFTKIGADWGVRHPRVKGRADGVR